MTECPSCYAEEYDADAGKCTVCAIFDKALAELHPDFVGPPQGILIEPVDAP